MLLSLISNNKVAAVHIAVWTPAQNIGLKERFLQIYSFRNENTTEKYLISGYYLCKMSLLTWEL